MPRHRIVGMQPCAEGYRALCECGWTSKPARRGAVQSAFHDHTYPAATLEELVIESELVWRAMQGRQDRQGRYYEDCAAFILELVERAQEAA